MNSLLDTLHSLKFSNVFFLSKFKKLGDSVEFWKNFPSTWKEAVYNVSTIAISKSRPSNLKIGLTDWINDRKQRDLEVLLW